MSEQHKVKNDQNETLKAGCVVTNENGEVLIVSDKEGQIYAFPKGHVEDGETLEEVALREVEEETGYRVEITKRFSDMTYVHGGTGELIRVAMFEAKPIEKTGAGEEHMHAKWVSKAEAETKLYPNLVYLLKE